MKVICIDAHKEVPKHWMGLPFLLRDNVIYTVHREFAESYSLEELLSIHPTHMYFKKRFIPISEIDEMELVNKNEFSKQLK